MHAFFANDTDADVRLKDHTDVVATVTDRASTLSGKLSNLIRDDGFLCRAAPAYTDRRRLRRAVEESLFKASILQNNVESATVNHEKRVCAALKIRKYSVSLVVILNVAHVEDLLASLFETC